MSLAYRIAVARIALLAVLFGAVSPTLAAGLFHDRPDMLARLLGLATVRAPDPDCSPAEGANVPAPAGEAGAPPSAAAAHGEHHSEHEGHAAHGVHCSFCLPASASAALLARPAIAVLSAVAEPVLAADQIAGHAGLPPLPYEARGPPFLPGG